METDEKMQAILELQKAVLENYKNNQILNENMCILNNTLDDVFALISQLNAVLENQKYEFLDPKIKKEDLFFPKIESEEKSIEKIINERKSMARYGDGEFSIMAKIERPKFQKVNDKLAERLKEVILTSDERILIAIADNYGNLQKYNKLSADSIRLYMTEDVRRQHKMYLSREKIYENAYISRPYVIYKDNMTDAPAKRFANLKRIWDKRNVILVEGALTRTGMGNDLLGNCKSISKILAPAVNSFDRYDDILAACKQYGKDDTLFLIAMGPSAGVLAYDLAVAGYQALDIGHLDLEYEWFLQGKGKRVPVKNKYNNELDGGDQVAELVVTEEYKNQVLARFD